MIQPCPWPSQVTILPVHSHKKLQKREMASNQKAIREGKHEEEIVVVSSSTLDSQNEGNEDQIENEESSEQVEEEEDVEEVEEIEEEEEVEEKKIEVASLGSKRKKDNSKKKEKFFDKRSEGTSGRSNSKKGDSKKREKIDDKKKKKSKKVEQKEEIDDKKTKKSKKVEQKEDEKSALYSFPMHRVSRIIKSENSDIRMFSEAVFLINKASDWVNLESDSVLCQDGGKKSMTPKKDIGRRFGGQLVPLNNFFDASYKK